MNMNSWSNKVLFCFLRRPWLIWSNKVLVCLLRRAWLGALLGLWAMLSVAYFWWLISRINFLETQNKLYSTQLQMSQSAMRQISIDSLTTYKVPEIPDDKGTLCETIHVSLVCMGKCTRQITTTLKSLLHHRQNPLHFHLIVDASSQATLSNLFDTWDLPDVKYTCYNAQNYIRRVSWIPNRHYSGVYGLLKLLFPDILPSTINKVIVLDSDLTFLCNVAELWALFNDMTGDQFIGLVENESNWYYQAKSDVWPALGRGYNTGVMLLDLQKIRTNVNWTHLWNEAVNNNINTRKETTLADQDVINVVIKKYPNVLHNVSCQYNVQMSTKSLAKNCYGEDRNNVKIIHWNSPTKYNVTTRDSNYFRSIHYSYINLDGNLLREKLHRCWKSDPVGYKINKTGVCESFRAAQRVKLRTHTYYMDYSLRSTDDDFDVTLVLQLSIDRLQFLERLVEHWDGPISAAIYLADCDVNKFEKFIQDWSNTLKSRKNIGYHLVFKYDAVHYPVNYLRNVALENVNTPYVFLMDVDFVPMPGLYRHLKQSIKLVNPYPQKKCLVVAAFETLRYRASLPRNKSALLARLSADVAPFRAREWPRGHRATNYTRWTTATKPYQVDWQPDYEPYLVVHRSVPKYDIRFSGFGWNKVSHIVELRAQGYKAVVLPDAFVVHTTHAPSADIAAFRTNLHYRICLTVLKQEFLEDLKRKHNVTFEELSNSDPLNSSQAKSLLLNQPKTV